MKNQLIKILVVSLPWLSCLPVGAEDVTKASVTPSLTYARVDGDEHRFQQDWWVGGGFSGGVEELTIDRALRGDWQLHFDARAIFDEEDYAVRLELVKPEVGFVRAGYTEYRKYFDDSGGYYNFISGADSFALGQALHMDIGNVFVELGLTLPNWPTIMLGYEHKFKEGTKSMVEWGSATRGAISRNILPASKEIDDKVDIFKVDLEHDINNVHIGNQFRYEKYDFDATRLDDTSRIVTNAAPAKSVVIMESYKHELFSNTFHMESHVSEKVYWSAAYLYSTLDGEPGFTMDTDFFPVFGGTSSGTDKFWTINNAFVDQDSHVLNVNGMFGPFFKKSTYFYGGIQAEKTQTDAFADVNLAETGAPNEAAVVNTHNDKDWFQERIGIRFQGIKYTTLYAEAKFDQGSVALSEEEVLTGLSDPAIATEIVERYTDTDVTREDYRVGFNTSPMRRVNLSGYYRHNRRDNDYNNILDVIAEEDLGGLVEVEENTGYSAYIENQKLTTDEISAKINVRPCSKLALSFKYQMVATDIDTQFQTAGAGSQSGNYDANIYSASITLTPVNRLYLTGLFSYRDSRTIAQDNNSAAITTWDGDSISVVAAAGYALDNKTDLRCEYLFSTADSYINNASAGLPLGVDYDRHAVFVTLSRKLRENVIARLRYGFSEYTENSTNGLNDYTAHLFSGSCTIRF